MNVTTLTKEAAREHALELCSTLLVIDPAAGPLIDPEPPTIDGVSYLDRLTGAGFDTGSVTLAAHLDGFDDFLKNVYSNLSLLAAMPERVVQVKTVQDLREAKAAGKFGLIFGSQTGSIVADKGWKWSIAHALGLRVCTLTYSERNLLGDGCNEPENRGLTALGRQAVQDMNRLGITIDISHVGAQTSEEIIDWSATPVIASHSNARSLTPSLRNLSTTVMEKLAARGGVMGISSFSAMCFKEPGVRPNLSDYLDMIDHCVDQVGIDHVGIGTDMYESYTKISWTSKTKRRYPSPWVFETRYAEGFDSISQFPDVVEGLVTRGYSDAQIAALLGDNWLRVFEQTWDATPAMLTGGWAAMHDTYGVKSA